MLTITEKDFEPGALIVLDDQVREVKRLVRHPAGTIIQWRGEGDYATTHNSLDYAVAHGVLVRRP